MKNIHISFLRALIVSIIVCISPSNMLGYLSPFLFLLVLMFSSKVALNYVFKNSFIFLFFVINLLCFYKFVDNSYVMGNGFLSILTYGSFIPVLLLPSKFFTEQKIITKISKIILVIIIIESLIGIIQSIYGFFSTGFYDLSNGDFVEGTIHPNLESEKSMSNPIFAIILSSLLIFILAFKDDIKFSKPVLLIGFFTFFLASVNHLIFFLMVSTIISYIIFKPKIFYFSNKILKIFLIFNISIISFFSINILLNTNFAQLINTAGYLLENRYPKTKILYTFYNNSDSLDKMIGLGPGQAISRASFISTGSYFGGNSSSLDIPFLKPSNFFKEHVNEMWLSSLKTNVGSSTSSQIQSSWGAVLTEFGLISFISIIIMIIYFLFKARRLAKNEKSKKLGFAFSTTLIYLFFMGIQQNYWEVSQAVFISVIFLKIYYTNLIVSSCR